MVCGVGVVWRIDGREERFSRRPLENKDRTQKTLLAPEGCVLFLANIIANANFANVILS